MFICCPLVTPLDIVVTEYLNVPVWSEFSLCCCSCSVIHAGNLKLLSVIRFSAYKYVCDI